MMGLEYMGILVLIIPVTVVILIISLVSRRNNGTDKGDENFAEMIRTIYMYTILIASLFMIIVGVVSMFGGIMDLLLPTNYAYSAFDNNNNMYMQNSINQANVQIITSAATLITALVLFVYHSRKIVKIKLAPKKNEEKVSK